MPRILIIKTSSMGDVVHNLPMVTDIVRNVPQAVIDWVVEEAFADIPALHPKVSQVIPVALRRWRWRLFDPGIWREWGQFKRQLRAHSYDVVLDSQGLLKSALIGRLATGDYWGPDHASAREASAAWFYQHTAAVPKGRHAVWRNRALAAAAFGYDLDEGSFDYGIRPPAPTPEVALPARYVVCLHAASRGAKLWQQEHWITLGLKLTAYGLNLVFPWGTAAERRRAQQLAQALPRAVVLPRLRLLTLASVLNRAQAVIGVDTGLVHLAAALGRPTVALYIDSNSTLSGVLGPDAQRTASLGGPNSPPRVSEVIDALGRIGAGI